MLDKNYFETDDEADPKGGIIVEDYPPENKNKLVEFQKTMEEKPFTEEDEDENDDDEEGFTQFFRQKKR